MLGKLQSKLKLGSKGTVLRPFPQPESPLSSQESGLRLQVPATGFEHVTSMLGVARTKNLYENRKCNQWDNWRAYGPELLL